MMNQTQIVDALLELRFQLQDGGISEYAWDYDNALGVCDRVTEEIDLILKEITA